MLSKGTQQQTNALHWPLFMPEQKSTRQGTKGIQVSHQPAANSFVQAEALEPPCRRVFGPSDCAIPPVEQLHGASLRPHLQPSASPLLPWFHGGGIWRSGAGSGPGSVSQVLLSQVQSVFFPKVFDVSHLYSPEPHLNQLELI